MSSKSTPSATFARGAVLAAIAVALFCACANSISAGSDAPIVDPGPSLVSTDANVTTPSEAGPELCNAYECPAPYATCPGVSGLCTTDLSHDLNHCGSCDNACPNSLIIRQRLHATFLCAQSACKMSCVPSFGDCNNLVDDGCETDTDSDPNNCGGCGTVCPAGAICWKGGCGCPTGYTQCGSSCVKLDEDDSNCGACNNVCSEPGPGDSGWLCGDGNYPPNTAFNCSTSKCGMHCAVGFANCNTDTCGDGCETATAFDHENCGTCGNACKPEQICFGGKCICGDDKTRCDTGCVDLQSDVNNCGACGNVCPGLTDDGIGSHGGPVCRLGRCTYECAPGYADCDHRIETGCEVDLMVDPRNCGSCGATCDLRGGQPCAAGKCLTQPCDAGGVK